MSLSFSDSYLYLKEDFQNVLLLWLSQLSFKNELEQQNYYSAVNTNQNQQLNPYRPEGLSEISAGNGYHVFFLFLHS